MFGSDLIGDFHLRLRHRRRWDFLEGMETNFCREEFEKSYIRGPEDQLMAFQQPFSDSAG